MPTSRAQAPVQVSPPVPAGRGSCGPCKPVPRYGWRRDARAVRSKESSLKSVIDFPAGFEPRRSYRLASYAGPPHEISSSSRSPPWRRMSDCCARGSAGTFAYFVCIVTTDTHLGALRAFSCGGASHGRRPRTTARAAGSTAAERGWSRAPRDVGRNGTGRDGRRRRPAAITARAAAPISGSRSFRAHPSSRSHRPPGASSRSWPRRPQPPRRSPPRCLQPWTSFPAVRIRLNRK